MLDEACREGQKALRVPDLLTATTAARVSCLMIDFDRQTPKAQLKDRLKRACGYEVCSDEDSNSVNSYRTACGTVKAPPRIFQHGTTLVD